MQFPRLDYLRETPSQTAGPYVHIGLIPHQAGFDIFEQTCGVRVPYTITGRRPGDVTSLVADATRVAVGWGWRPARDLAGIFTDAWRFHQRNPDGFVGRPGQAAAR